MVISTQSVKILRNFFLCFVLLGLLSQFLSPLLPVFIEAAEKQQQVSLDKKDQTVSVPATPAITDEQNQRYQKVEYNQTESNCTNPVGWEENLSKKDLNIKYFWVPRNKDVPKSFTRSTNPEYFTTVVCSYTTQVNYKDKADGKIKDINNDLKELDVKNTLRSKDGYKYVNSGNDFNAYFPEDPNSGWFFENKDGQKVKVTKVTIADKKLNFNPKNKIKVEGSAITYIDVLPFVDLQYKVDNEGVSKFFILKNENALRNDLSKIEFTIDAGDKKLIKKNDLNDSIAADIKKKLDAKSKEDVSKKIKDNKELSPEDVQSQLDSQTEVKNAVNTDLGNAPKEIKDAIEDIKSNDPKRVEKASKLDEAKQKKIAEQLQKEEKKSIIEERNKQLDILKKQLQEKKLDSKDKLKVSDEIAKIVEKTNSTDVIEFSGGNIKVGVPITYEEGSQGIKTDTFKVSGDGKTLTIYPDTDYLKAKERKFPITIDPRYVNGNTTAADGWYNSYSPTSSRGGSGNNFHLVVGGNACINVGTSSCAWMGVSRSAIRFNIPGEVQSAGNVVWANFRLRQYSSNGGGFGMKVSNACDFNESNVTWNTQPCIANDYGSAGVGGTNCSSPGCGGDVWTNDIGQLLRDNLNGGARDFKVVLRDDTESRSRGAAFCSKDGWNGGHPCNNGTNQGPYLQIYLNESPSAPNAELPDNGDFIGKCDKSVTPNTGNCGRTLGIDYKISNINDGDGDADCNAASSRIVQKSNYTESIGWPWYPFWGPTQRGCPAGDLIRTYNIQTSNGKYDWAAINRDSNGAESANWSNTRKFSVDSQPPVKVGSFSLQDYARGDKLNIKSPDYGDNLLDKYWIEFAANTENTNYLRLNSGNNQVVGTSGSNVVLSEAVNSDTQKWFLSIYQFKLEQGGRTLCLSANPVENSAVTTTTCQAKPNLTNPNTTQNWVQKANGQLALLINQNFCVATENGGTLAGTKLVMKACDDNNYNQKLTVERLTGTSRRVDVNNGGAASTTNIHLWDGHDGENQMWYLESNGLLRSVQGRCLSIVDLPNGSRVNYWDCHNDTDPNQKNMRWAYTDKKELKNIGTGRCLDVNGGGR